MRGVETTAKRPAPTFVILRGGSAPIGALIPAKFEM
jgi:hypothetical protein